MKSKLIYLTPLLLAMLVFSSNFMDTSLFKFGDLNFAVWFILSVFCFACGWLINNTLGWRYGGRIVFAVIVSTTLLSVVLITVFKDYFGSSELLTENLILYSLRNVTLGCMAFFGMTFSELLVIQKEIANQRHRIDSYEQLIIDARKEAELELKEAKLQGEKIIFEAETQARKFQERKDKLEKDLRDLIQTEKELIKKYEEK